MSGPPYRSGFVQVAVRLVDEPATCASVGLSGLSDFSLASSVRLIVTASSPLSVPSDAFTVTE